MERKAGHLTKSIQEIAGSLFWIKARGVFLRVFFHSTAHGFVYMSGTQSKLSYRADKY